MKKLLLVILVLTTFSCINDSNNTVKNKIPPVVKKMQNKTKNKNKKFKGKPKSINEDLYNSVIAERDSIRQLLKERKSNYVKKKNNYKSNFPEITKIILIKMKEEELKRQKIPSKYLTEEFYDMYDIEYTNVKVLKFIDDRINDFISYLSIKTRLDFTKIDSTNFIKIKK